MLLSICLDSAFPASTCVCIFIPAGTHATVHAQNAKMKRAETQEWNVYMRVLFQSNWARTIPFLFIIFFFFGRTCTSTSHQPRSFFDSYKKKKNQTTLHPRTNHPKPYKSNPCEKKNQTHQMDQAINRSNWSNGSTHCRSTHDSSSWNPKNPSTEKIKTIKPKPYESNPCEKKEKSNPSNGTYKPIHQANANQTH